MAIQHSVVRKVELSTDYADNKLVELVELLQKIDASNPISKLNETSMPDNNGGRIKF